MLSELTTRFRRTPLWGLQGAPREALRARAIERRWRWPVQLLLAGTVPAFYAELLASQRQGLATWAYLLAALGVAVALLHTAARCREPGRHLLANPLDLLLVPLLVLAAALPLSHDSGLALGFRTIVAFLTLTRMVWGLQHLITRGGLAYLLLIAAVVLGLCGVGFWLLEPRTPTFGDGLWLAFTTAATVGYGDLVPTTPASKIFSVFVVMLGFGVLSLVTAAIATRWVETEERTIEREIMRDMHRQIDSLRQDIAELRHTIEQQQLHRADPASDALPAAAPPATVPTLAPTTSPAPEAPAPAPHRR